MSSFAPHSACLRPGLSLRVRSHKTAAGCPIDIEFRRLVAANRILAREEVVDAFGHVSIRDPENPKRYVMARSRAPSSSSTPT